MKNYYNSIKGFKSGKECQAALQKIYDTERAGTEQQIIKKMKDEFVIKNIPLILKVVSAYRLNNRNMDDIIQEGVIGVMRALEKYDPKLNVKFGKYAWYWIYCRIHRFICWNSRTAYIPEGQEDMARRLMKKNEKNLVRYNQQISYEDCGENITEKKFESLMDYNKHKLVHMGLLSSYILDLETAKHEHEPLSCLDNIENRENAIMLKKMLNKICTRDKMVFLGRLSGDSLEKIGDKLSVSRERVRQIEVKVVKFLNETIKQLRRKGIKYEEINSNYGCKYRNCLLRDNGAKCFGDDRYNHEYFGCAIDSAKASRSNGYEIVQ